MRNAHPPASRGDLPGFAPSGLPCNHGSMAVGLLAARYSPPRPAGQITFRGSSRPTVFSWDFGDGPIRIGATAILMRSLKPDSPQFFHRSASAPPAKRDLQRPDAFSISCKSACGLRPTHPRPGSSGSIATPSVRSAGYRLRFCSTDTNPCRCGWIHIHQHLPPPGKM
jgi:hypothetical protein